MQNPDSVKTFLSINPTGNKLIAHYWCNLARKKKTIKRHLRQHYLVEQRHNRNLIKQENTGLIFCMPAIKKVKAVVIGNLKKKKTKVC